MGTACHGSGGLLATAGADRKVLVWDVDGGFCTHYFRGHKGVVTCIMFHPDPNRLLVSFSFSSRFLIYCSLSFLLLVVKENSKLKGCLRRVEKFTVKGSFDNTR